MRHATEPKLNMRAGRKHKMTLNGRMRVKSQKPKSFERSRDPQPGELAARLDRLADVRKSAVMRGKALIANPEYPNRKTMRAVARLLARHLRA